jgi:heme/copper-type cytochrome/quinol oxidase subunit 4
MKRLIAVYISLVLLTLIGASVAELQMSSAWVPVAIIMVLVCIKFMMVVLEYMEMRKSNRAWKVSVLLPVVVTALLIGILALV